MTPDVGCRLPATVTAGVTGSVTSGREDFVLDGVEGIRATRECRRRSRVGSRQRWTRHVGVRFSAEKSRTTRSQVRMIQLDDGSVDAGSRPN